MVLCNKDPNIWAVRIVLVTGIPICRVDDCKVGIGGPPAQSPRHCSARRGQTAPNTDRGNKKDWVAVKELKLSYCIGETLLFTIYTHYGDVI